MSYSLFLFSLISCLCAGVYFGNRTPDLTERAISTDRAPDEINSARKDNHQVESQKVAHQFHSMGKPGAAVKLKNNTPLLMAEVGEQEYVVELVSSIHSGKMTVDLLMSDGITIISPERRVEFELGEEGEYRVPLKLRADTEGRFYIQMHISIAANGVSSSRVIAAILQVGSVPMKAQKTSRKKGAVNEAENVISLPAQESISPR